MKNLKLYLLLIAISTALLFTNCTNEENYDNLNPNSNANAVISNEANLDLSSLALSIGVTSGDTETNTPGEIVENPWINTSEEPISTFSIDADGGSYANIRKQLEADRFPSPDIVRTEEIINFFQMDYPEPGLEHPISLNGEIADCPWNQDHKLLRIGIKGKYISRENMPPANFVFLIDVSGSMNSPDKLDLLKEGFKIYADYMRPEDLISIVTYSGSWDVILTPTPGNLKEVIKTAIDRLSAGGSTNGEGGINEAYSLAESSFIPGGNNRVILGTDGDFNIGVSTVDELVGLIEVKRETGIFLSVLGVGAGNFRDSQMEQLANNGNGTYEFIDDIEQAQKVFVEEFGKFYTVAKDVKIQIDFDPNFVQKYRLIGYENRILDTEDFLDDTEDAGEIGSDQKITALYELQTSQVSSQFTPFTTVDFRYKLPDSNNSKGMTLDIFNQNTPFSLASENTRFAAAAAGYGLMLRDSEYKGSLTWNNVYQWANQAQTFDPNNHRSEFLTWILKAEELDQ